MKSKAIRYLFFVLYGMLVASGPICMVYITTPEDPGNVPFWLVVPFTVLVTAAMVVIFRVFYPRLFLRGRYLSFGLAVWGLSYVMDLLALYIGHYFMAWHHLPHYLKNPYSPWLFLSALSSSMLSVLTVAGFFLWRFYDLHKEQNRCEELYRQDIEACTERLKSRIRMPEIRGMLREALETLKTDADRANDLILDISDYLRRNLYGDTSERTNPLPEGHWEADSSHTSAFLTERKWRVARHLLMLGVIGLICFALMFDYPDEIFWDVFHVKYSLTFFCIICALIYANIFLIFPFFLKKDRQRLYALLLASISAMAFIALNTVSMVFGPPYNPFGVKIPLVLVPMAVAGNLMTFVLLMAGSAALVLLKRNILGKWRLSRLEAQTAEIEFATLQHQINPHTLFNFLNNIAILGYEDPEEAAQTLRSLEEMLDYIVADTSRPETTVEEEIRFIRNYLTLEKSSGRELDVEIRCPESVLPHRIPPLLLLPFVENAVKHSRDVESGRRIEMDFQDSEGGLLFVCRNSCPEGAGETSEKRNVISDGKEAADGRKDSSGSKKRSGGLGIANTKRRLQLLFGSSELLAFDKQGEVFSVRLLLPGA